MARDHAETVHRDFRMVERGEIVGDAPLIGLRTALRSAWTLPTDTFVTSDFPVLLTRLCHPPEPYDIPTGPQQTHD